MGELRQCGLGFAPRRWIVLTAALALLIGAFDAAAQNVWVEELVSAVVRIKTHINPDGRTVDGLGREREGSGIVIDSNGLVVTIGYLMVEAYAAEVIDNSATRCRPMWWATTTKPGSVCCGRSSRSSSSRWRSASRPRSRSTTRCASFGGSAMVGAAYVVAKREFAGNWEYMLDKALFTAPPHPAWSGAALINREGKLVGVGSLIVGDAAGGSEKTPGNMFVPIDRLPPILGDLITDGHPAGPGRPWLGVNADEVRGRLLVSRVTPGGPAEAAGIKRGDIIVGVKGDQPKSLADFYRKVWAQGAAGATVTLDVLQDAEVRHVDVKSINRRDHLKLKSTF